ncbi:MAG: hypothetical protein IIB45_10395 [Candidatus Marinimicrobia bacterium]|nr:hypothetical protein [Candidatus Neomarinimicrobiota bacterium]
METHPEEFKLTEEDIQKIEQKIASFDLSRESSILAVIPQKLESLLKSTQLNAYTVRLVNDVTRLYNLIIRMPNLNDELKGRILYALDYFVDKDDEIPDEIPDLGYIDDLVIVRYIVDKIIVDHTDIIQS